MKKIKFITCLVICQSLIFGFHPPANGQNWQWAKQSYDTGTKYGWSISSDSAGNLYITGSFSNTAIFDTDTLTSTGLTDVFIVKYDNSGNVLWASQAGGTDTIVGYGIISDNSGNSYITGYFKDTICFEGDTLISTGGRDVFVTKYDLSGNVLWAERAGSTTDDEGFGIRIDDIGNSYVTGYFTGTSYFGSDTLNEMGGQDMFLAKYDTSGNVLWARQAGNTGWDEGDALCVDASGNVYVTGVFEGTVIFGPETLTSSGYSDVFIARYDPSGNILWASQGGGSGWYDGGLSIAVDNSGNSYITGYYYGPATFGVYTLPLIGSYDMFLVKYDTSGNELWANEGGGTGVNGDWGSGIVIDLSNNCYVTGRMEDISTFGSVVLNSAGDEDVFVVKYNPSGSAVWGKKAGGADVDVGNAIVTDVLGNNFVTGTFQGAAFFDNDTLNSLSGDDVFIAKLSPPPPVNVIISKIDIACYGLCEGQATASISGGTSPYTYSWNTGESTPTIDSLCAGNYNVTVIDANSDTTMDSITITAPPVLSAIITESTYILCNGESDGTAVVTPSGGILPYTYLWNDGLGQTTSTATGLCAGTYTLIVTDANGCTYSATITINEPPELTDFTIVTDTTLGNCDGEATVIVSGGTPPYSYQWDNGDITATAGNLCEGIYYITVTDSNGCTIIDSVSVSFTGLKDFPLADEINIYPNPNSGEFVIEINIDKPQNLIMKLFDIKGQLMLEEDINKIPGIYRKTINLKGYSKGVYHLQILVDGVVVNRNIVVQ
ncbi:MAG: T9SS type A sorting domain-containing protein [Bacteroidota bacterium]